MGFRFRNVFSLGKLFRINIGKTLTPSISFGPRGSTITIGKKGIYGNIGLPGTGLSYRTRLDQPKTRRSSVSKKDQALVLFMQNRNLSRKRMIELFVERLGIARSTASSYYSHANRVSELAEG